MLRTESTMTATLDGKRGKPAIQMDGKELVNRLRCVTGQVGDLSAAVDARFWMGKSASSSVVYCSVWIRPPIEGAEGWPSGRGSAGGGGYHKESAALEDALRSAGVRLSQEVGGVGERAMHDALIAVARAVGYQGPLQVI